MSTWSLIMVGLLILTVLVLVITIFVVNKRKKEGKMREPNYQVFFILGICWMPVGIVFMTAVNTAIGIAFMVLGMAYLAIGLANRDKWDKKGK